MSKEVGMCACVNLLMSKRSHNVLDYVCEWVRVRELQGEDMVV
jgi:hypothetical protein